MEKLITLKEIAEKYEVSVQRVKSIFLRAGIEPRTLSNIELRDLQWEGHTKRALKGVFVEPDVLDSPAFKIELVRHKSQHEANEIFGQMAFDFE